VSIDITFTLSNDDLKHFEDIVAKAREMVDNEQDAKKVEEAAQQMLDQANSAQLPDFIAERILSALSYFAMEEDLIPDHIPGVGFLDDAIYTEIIIQELDSELRLYNEFCQYRIAEENRRRSRGLDPKVGREDWLADKRSVLHSRMRARRSSGSSSGHRWRTGFL
jgi:uncharacterized membrane protein YkvA (DUF1232 family)